MLAGIPLGFVPEDGMKSWKTWISIAGVVLAALPACRSTKIVPTGLNCGPGTVNEGGQCVPAATTQCGPGTVLVGKQCQASCPAGTTLSNGQCVVSSSVCGPGTMLVNNQCISVDPLSQVTVPESPEPNDSASTAAKFTLPDIGASPAVLGGTIGEVQSGKADFDWFVFQGTAQQKIHIEAMAVGAPSIGLILTPVAAPPVMMPPIQRYVFSLDSRTAVRDVVLPVSGAWAMEVSDLDNLGITSGALSGGPAFTYVVKVSQVAASSPQMLAPGQVAMGAFTDSDVYQLTPDAMSVPIVNLSLGAPTGDPGFQGVRTVWATDSSGKLLFNDVDTMNSDGSVQPLSQQQVLVPSDGMIIGVDYVYAISQPGPFTLTAQSLPATQVGNLMAGSAYSDAGQLSVETQQTHIYALQIPANGLIDATVTADSTDLKPTLELRDVSFNLVASAPAGDSPAELWAYVPAGQDGLYFLVVSNARAGSSGADLKYSLQIQEVLASAASTLAVPGNTYVSASLDSSEVAFAVPIAAAGLARFTVTPSATATISARAATAGGQVLVASDPSAASMGQAVVLNDVLVTQPEVLLVIVTGMSGSGSVRLEADAEPTVVVKQIAGNTRRATAQPISTDYMKPTVIEGALTSGSNTNFYSFTFSGGIVTVDSQQSGQTALPAHQIDIVDGNGRNYGTGSSYSGPVSVTSNRLQPGTYYIKIQGAGGAGPYALIVQEMP